MSGLKPPETIYLDLKYRMWHERRMNDTDSVYIHKESEKQRSFEESEERGYERGLRDGLFSTKETWLHMDLAPKDSTLIQLLVSCSSDGSRSCNPTEDARLFRTIGHNSFDYNGHDEWQFAGWNWEQNCFSEGRGTPVGWLPLPQLPPE